MAKSDMVESVDMNLRAEKDWTQSLLLTLKEELQKTVRADSWKEQVWHLKVTVHKSEESFICASASSCLDYSPPCTWVSEYSMWRKRAVYFYFSV